MVSIRAFTRTRSNKHHTSQGHATRQQSRKKMSARKLVRKAHENGKVFGTKKSRKIQFSPGPQAKGGDYVTPQMNNILTLPRAPVKSFKKRYITNDCAKGVTGKSMCKRPRRNRFPPQVLPYDDTRDDIDIDIDNIDNSTQTNTRKYFTNEVIGIPMSNLRPAADNVASGVYTTLEPLQDFSLEKNGFTSSTNHHADYENNVRAILNRFDGTKPRSTDALGVTSRTRANNLKKDSNEIVPVGGWMTKGKPKKFSLQQIAWIDSPSITEEGNEDNGIDLTTQEKIDANHHDVMKCLFGDED